MASDYCAEAHQVLQETSGQDTHTFHLYVYFSSYLQEDDAWVQDWYSLFPASVTFRCENGVWQPVEYWGFYGSDSYDPRRSVPRFPGGCDERPVERRRNPRSSLTNWPQHFARSVWRRRTPYFAQHPGSS